MCSIEKPHPPENYLIRFSRYWVWKISASFAFSWGWCYKLQHSCSLHLLTLKSRWKSLLSHSFPGCIFNKVGEFVEGNRLMVDVCIIRPAACHQCVKNLFLPFLLSTCLSPCYFVICYYVQMSLLPWRACVKFTQISPWSGKIWIELTAQLNNDNAFGKRPPVLCK